MMYLRYEDLKNIHEYKRAGAFVERELERKSSKSSAIVLEC